MTRRVLNLSTQFVNKNMEQLGVFNACWDERQQIKSLLTFELPCDNLRVLIAQRVDDLIKIAKTYHATEAVVGGFGTPEFILPLLCRRLQEVGIEPTFAMQRKTKTSEGKYQYEFLGLVPA